MPGDRDERLIADKYPLDYTRQPLATRLWRWRLNCLALLLACGIAAAIYAFRGEAAFWSAPVADVHASFGSDCAQCHTESWQPALRVASLDSGRHSVPDSACKACHTSTGEHHPQIGEPEPACASCHQEHRPAHPLMNVSDNQCASCHADLSTVSGGEIHFADAISHFGPGTHSHPEFALLRGSDDLADKLHGAWKVAQPSPEAASQWLDNSGVLFNHKVHLAAEGILDPSRKQVQLVCADCHQPEADGRYMKPISYEQHCAACHPLQLADKLADLGVLPHEAPELVRGTIRERLAEAERGSNVEQEKPRPSRIPRLPKPAILNSEQAQSAEQKLLDADSAVFGLEAKGLCRKCHYVQRQGTTWVVPLLNPNIVLEGGIGEENKERSMIPSRWLQHGAFHHEKHDTLECQQCHAVEESALTSDILLPGIENCRKCHTNSPATIGPGVRADCVLCHDYHGPSSLSASVGSLGKVLSQAELQEGAR